MKKIQNYKTNKISLDEIQKFYEIQEYLLLYDMVVKLIETHQITPIIASKLNGKKPALYKEYRITREKMGNEQWEAELKYLVPQLQSGYYLKHLNQYQKDREFILLLNQYFIQSQSNLKEAISINERSFEIFSREKFIVKEGGLRILKNLGLPSSYLNYYETSQPLSYYSHNKNIGQIMVIVENKDTFYSMRKYLIEENETIFSIPIGTLIYGGGKAIYRSVQDFLLCLEPYMKSTENKVLYFGDLDYEGILIFEHLKTIMEEIFPISPFVQAYECMIKKSENKQLPKTKEAQNDNCGEAFFSYFTFDIEDKMKQILQKKEYIPQEIVQMKDFR